MSSRPCTLIYILMFMMSALSSPGFAQSLPNDFTVEGRIYQTDGVTPLNTNADIVLEVLNDGDTCVLYSETYANVNLFSSNANALGAFALRLGSGAPNSPFVSAPSLSTLFSSGTNIPGFTEGADVTYGGACNANPVASDHRVVRVKVRLTASGGSYDLLSPDTRITAVPTAIIAENANALNGIPESSFLLTNTNAGSALIRPNVENVFSSTNYPRLVSLLSVPPTNYLQTGSNGSLAVPPVSNQPGSGLSAGQFWFDSVGSVLKYYDGAVVKTVGVSGASIDGSTITSGTIGGSTAISTSGNIQTSGSTTQKSVYLYDNSGAGPGYVRFLPPANMAGSGGSSYTLTYPDRAGASGQVLVTSNSTGTLTWLTPSSGSVTSVALSLPSFIAVTGSPVTGNGTLTGTLATQTANAVFAGPTTGGAASPTFRSLVAADLPSIDATLLTSGTLAADRFPALTGDVTNSAGSLNTTVGKIQGQAIAATPPTDPSQILKFNGTLWEPGFVGVTDIRSAVNPTFQFFPTNCGADQTLVWQSPTATMACTSISISYSSVIGLGSAALQNLASFVLNGGQTGAITAGPSDANALTLQTSGSPHMTIIPSGYVGIGTTNPSAPMQVSSTSIVTSGNTYTVKITPTYNQTLGSAANTDLLINRTQTAVGAGSQYLIDAQVGGASKFNVDNNGTLTVTGTINAPTFSGNAATATTATKVATTPTFLNASYYPLFVSSSAGGSQAVDLGTGLSFNPSSNTLTTSTILTGDGSSLAPGFSFMNEPSLGMFRFAPNMLSLAVGGFRPLDVTGSGISVQGLLTLKQSNGTTYSSTGASPAPTGPTILSQNQWSGDSTGAFSNWQVRNTGTTFQSAYMGAIANNSGSAPAIVIGQQTGAAAYAERMRIDASGNVGIGTASPRANLDVNGVILSKAGINNGGATTIDFSTGNSQFTILSCGAFILYNLRDGGNYLFAVKGTSMATCSFVGYSDAGVTGITVHPPPDIGPTAAGKHTLFTLAVIGTDVYVSWTPGY